MKKVKIEDVIIVDSIDWRMVDNVYGYQYHGKFVADKHQLSYFTTDGKMVFSLGYIIDHPEIKVTIKDLLDLYTNRLELDKVSPEKDSPYEGHKFVGSLVKTKSLESITVGEITQLKASGFGVEEIVLLREKGII